MSEIYEVKCISTGKYYIGQVSLYDSKGNKRGYEKRWKEHVKEAEKYKSGSRALNNAIRKYGERQFVVTSIRKCPKNLANYYEAEIIAKYDCVVPNGYNIQSGGQKGKKHCKESREIMRSKKLGENNPNYGKERSLETKTKISLSKKGNKHHFYGKKLSDEHKEKLSKSHKKGNYDLQMYMIYVKPRPEHYSAEGYAIVNHPNGKNKYFTSSKLKLSEKYDLAFKYLNELNSL